jgi:cytochrome P450
MPTVPRFLTSAIANWAQDAVSTLRAGAPLPPSPPITNQLLGHLHDIREEGYVRFQDRCVASYGSLFLLRLGPPVLGRRVLVIADPEIAHENLTRDLHREFVAPIGPPLVFGEDAVFCTAGDAPVHDQRRALLGGHLGRERMHDHARQMAAVWRTAVERTFAIPTGRRHVERFGINDQVLHAAQDAAIRCWLGVEPTAAETQRALDRYYDPGILLGEMLFNPWFFVRAHERVAALEDAYRPLLSRALDALAAKPDTPRLGFVAESLELLGWDRTRLAADGAYREQLLSTLGIYQHLFTVMLPSVGSTGGTMLFLLHELAGLPDFQERVRDELVASDLIAEPCAPRLTALAIKESLRLHPEAAGINRMLREPRSYGGYFVPKGTYTLVYLHALHRHPQSFRDPERFDPSRFAAPNASTGCKWAGFSHGKMACTGRGFAELHVATFLKETLSRYRVRRVDDQPLRHNDYRTSVTLQPEPFALRFEAVG